MALQRVGTGDPGSAAHRQVLRLVLQLVAGGQERVLVAAHAALGGAGLLRAVEHVEVQAAVVAALVRAERARVDRLLPGVPRVQALVAAQVGHLGEALAALLAHERLLAGVQPHVRLHVVVPGESVEQRARLVVWSRFTPVGSKQRL